MNSGSIRSKTLEDWWPTTQSLDLIEGPADAVAKALEAEVRLFTHNAPVHTAWEQVSDLDAAFRLAPNFGNVPTCFLVLPTRSRWSVLWYNTFLCNGYDSLCAMMAKTHGFTSLHWSSHDAWTTFQTGTHFIHRRNAGGTILKRAVYVSQQDKRWHFSQDGDPLPEEDLESYAARRKRDRLNEAAMAALLERLDARPWQEDYYDIPEQPVFFLMRQNLPATIIQREHSDVVKRPLG